jgi:hypothetical protein
VVTQLPESALAWILEPLRRVPVLRGPAAHRRIATAVRSRVRLPWRRATRVAATSPTIYGSVRSIARSLASITGRLGSPGRPADPPHEQYVKRLRGLSHRLSAARSQQPVPPSMPRPGAGRPSASGPAVPRPGP